IHFLFASQIQPGQDWSNVAICLSKFLVRKKHPAIPFRNACESDFIFTPIKSETEITLVVRRRFGDVSHWYLRNGARKLRSHLRLLKCFSLPDIRADLRQLVPPGCARRGREQWGFRLFGQRIASEPSTLVSR